MIMPSTFQNYRFRKYYQNLSPLFSSSRFQGYAMVVMSLFTIAFFGIFAIKPTLKTITVLNRQIVDKNNLNSQLDQKINNLILAQEQYQKIQNDLSLIYSLMPADPQFPLLFRKLELLAAENNTTISDVQFSPVILYQEERPLSQTETMPEANSAAIKNQASPASPKPILTTVKQVSSLSYILGFTGNYGDLISLLERLTKLDRLVTILSVELNNRSQNDEKSNLNITIDADSYYLPLSL